MSKLYQGRRTPDGCRVTVNNKPLPVRHEVLNHSPDGFEWGYGGSGPAQLALAILCDHLGAPAGTKTGPLVERAVRLHQDFKWRVIAALKWQSWSLTSGDVDEALNLKEAWQEKSA